MAGLFEHIGDVEADRPLRDAEQLGNLLARLAAADELQDLELALRQVGFRRTERIPAADDGKDVLARHRPPDAVDERLPRGFLIDEAVCTGIPRPADEGQLRHARHHDDADLWEALFEPAADPDAARATLHADIHEHQVRPIAQACLLRQLGQRARRADGNVRHRLKDLLEPFQQNFLVVHEQNINHRAPSNSIAFPLLYHRAKCRRNYFIADHNTRIQKSRSPKGETAF